jgi:chemotaxis methyl-accepting protein methylase
MRSRALCAVSRARRHESRIHPALHPRASGLNAGAYGNDLWRELLVKRLDTVGARSPEDYLARLRDDETELHTLTSLITINETYFYRESQHLRLLTERICPELLARRASDSPVRLLSVGCSTGEEPYSILMALRERYGELAERFFEVNAGDVDRAVLERARAGVYGRFSFRALSPQLQERYFSAVDANHFRIDESLRRRVSFQPLNLLAADYPETLAGQDVIFFRNVSIYFDEPTRRRVLERLKTLLAPGGYLIVGISETLANDFGILTLRERDGVFLFVNEPPGMETASVTRPLFEAKQKHIGSVDRLAPSPQPLSRKGRGARLEPSLANSGSAASTRRSNGALVVADAKASSPARAMRPAPPVLHADSGAPISAPVPVTRPSRWFRRFSTTRRRTPSMTRRSRSPSPNVIRRRSNGSNRSVPVPSREPGIWCSRRICCSSRIGSRTRWRWRIRCWRAINGIWRGCCYWDAAPGTRSRRRRPSPSCAAPSTTSPKPGRPISSSPRSIARAGRRNWRGVSTASSCARSNATLRASIRRRS